MHINNKAGVWFWKTKSLSLEAPVAFFSSLNMEAAELNNSIFGLSWKEHGLNTSEHQFSFVNGDIKIHPGKELGRQRSRAPRKKNIRGSTNRSLEGSGCAKESGELLAERVEEENDVKICGCGSSGDRSLEGMEKVEFLGNTWGLHHSPSNNTFEFHKIKRILKREAGVYLEPWSTGYLTNDL